MARLYLPSLIFVGSDIGDQVGGTTDGQKGELISLNLFQAHYQINRKTYQRSQCSMSAVHKEPVLRNKDVSTLKPFPSGSFLSLGPDWEFMCLALLHCIHIGLQPFSCHHGWRFNLILKPLVLDLVNFNVKQESRKGPTLF